MNEFTSNVPKLPEYERRQPKVDWKPDEFDLPQQAGQTKQTDNKQPVDQKMIQNLLNPSGDSADNPYDFGANLGEM